MAKFFTADLHLGHKNILKYCNRPFSDIEQHDRKILDNINCVVQPNDELYIAGDFCFGDPAKYMYSIACQNIYFILGSHDKQMWKFHQRNQDRFKFFGDVLISYIEGTSVTINHHAQMVWSKSHYGAIHLFGHSHGHLSNWDIHKPFFEKAKCMDIGVDTNNYKPYSWEEIKRLMDKKAGFLVNRKKEEEV
jgi:calcineurin-like phosphoesterase family protein